MATGIISQKFISFPSASTTERNAITAVNGMILKNSTNARLEFRSNNWTNLTKSVAFTAMSAAVAFTNQPNSEQLILSGNGRIIWKGDLSQYRECRLIIRVSIGSVSVNNPRLYLQYNAGASPFIGFAPISTVEHACSMTNTGFVDTGWFDMVSGACVNNVHIQPYTNGGNGSADPAVDNIRAMFR